MPLLSRLTRKAAVILAMLVLISQNQAGAETVAPSDRTSELTIRLVKLPSNTPRNATIYLSGDFNGWNPSDDRYRLTPDPQGQYSITLPTSIRQLSKFNLSLGEDPVGTNANGADENARPYLIMESETGTIYVAIQSWRDKEVKVSRLPLSPTLATKVRHGFGLEEYNFLGFCGLLFVIIIPGIIYILHLKRREQALLSANDITSLAEYQAKSKELSEAIATLQSNSKELERWSRAIER